MAQEVTEELMIQYLLGTLSETQQSQIEQAFFANNEFFEQLLSVEDALMDRYLLDKLSPDNRKAFEEFLRASPRQWQDLEMARDLIETVSKSDLSKSKGRLLPDSQSRARSPWAMRARRQPRSQPFSVLWLFALLAVSVSLLVWDLHILRQKMHAEAGLREAKEINSEMQQQNLEERERSERIARELEDEKARSKQIEQLIAQAQNPSQAATADIELSADVISRNSGSLKVIDIRPNVEKVQIHLGLNENVGYKEYSASIKSFDGREVWKSSLLGANQIRRGRLLLAVPGNVFLKDDYTVTLRGISEGRGPVEIADYSFRVNR